MTIRKIPRFSRPTVSCRDGISIISCVCGKRRFPHKTTNFHYSPIIRTETLGFCIFPCEVFKTFHFHLVPSRGGHSTLRSFGLLYYLITETETSSEIQTCTLFSHLGDKVFQPKEDEVKREWKKLYNEELNDLCSLPNIVWVFKSRKMRWSGHVARMGECRGA